MLGTSGPPRAPVRTSILWSQRALSALLFPSLSTYGACSAFSAMANHPLDCHLLGPYAPWPPSRQDDQIINLIILIILIIFVKQRTYLAPPPFAGSPNVKKHLKISNFKMVEHAAPGRDRAT